MDTSNETKRAIEVRCPTEQCQCSARGKLLATLIGFPREALGCGAVLQLACPNKKSRLIQVRI